MKLHKILLFALSLVPLYVAAEVQWIETEHDFGAFGEDMGKVRHIFRFVNTDASPVTIVAARPSCGCTAPEFSRRPVEPGDTGAIALFYNPAGRPGRFSKYVGVEMSNGQKTKLYVKGSVIGSAPSVARNYPVDLGMGLKMARPSVMFGQIAKGHTRAVSIDIYNRSEMPLHPSASCPPYISAIFEPATVAPGEQGTVMFTFDAGREKEYGLVSDTLLISADPLSSFLYQMPVMAVVNEDFGSLTPEQLDKAPVPTLEMQSIDFGAIKGDKKIKRICTVRNTGGSKMIVRRLYTADEGVSLSIDKKTIAPGKTATITVVVYPRRVKGDILNARATLITNSPSAPTVAVRLVGMK